MTKKTEQICKEIGICVMGLGMAKTISHFVSKRLTDIAVKRTLPKSMEKTKNRISGGRKKTEFREILIQKMEKLEKDQYEDVEITSYDGVKLTGHWKTCADPKRVIVAMHGWRSSWTKDFGLISDFFDANHCQVLYAEQRSQGKSGGEYIGFGLMERHDCLEWIHWVGARTKKELPVYLMGVSMGATTVLMTAGNALPSNVKGVIADCGFTSPHQIWKHVVKNNLHMPYHVHEKFIDRYCYKKMQLDTAEYSTITAMENCVLPVLFIHGTKDRFVPIEMTYENYQACHSPKRLFVVPGAEHAMSYYTDPAGYESEVKAFWDKYDLCGAT